MDRESTNYYSIIREGKVYCFIVKIMKKHPYSRITAVLTSLFNVRKWSDYDRVKSFTRYLGTAIKNFFLPDKAAVDDKTSEESFNKYVALHHLSEKDLEIQQKSLYRLSVWMCILALGLLGYAIYHLIFGTFRAVLVSLVVTGIALVLAFRYHFWYYQIKEKKLGCSFKEWYEQGLKGRKT